MAVSGELTNVDEQYQLTFKSEDTGVRAVTEKQTALPADLPSPIFWFDCKDQNGWEYEKIGGTNFVTKIPSKVGNRFLTTDLTLEGTTWTGWSKSNTLEKPWLADFEDLPGGPALDFGALGSRCAMLFNPYQYDGDGAPANNLRGVGSVVALYGSQNGGGYLLGGGNVGEGYSWNRALDAQNAFGSQGEAALPKFWCGLMRAADRRGTYYYNGVKLPAGAAGFGGAWEAISYAAPSTAFDTYGLGVGDSRQYMKDYSGGMRIAEMLIFDSVLTDDQLKRVAVYLQTKWLGTAPRRWNGNANVGQVRLYPRGGFNVELNAAEGETLSVGALRGGRAAEPQDKVTRRFVKTGNGALKLGDAAHYSGAIDVREGKLILSRKPIPTTADDLPHGLYVHFDASDPRSLVTESENGTNFVKTLRNLASGKRYSGEIFARPRLDVVAGNPTRTDLRPWVRDVGLASGRPIIDMGWRSASDGRYLLFGTNEVMTSSNYEYTSLSGVQCAVAVVRVEAHGGNLMDGAFARNYPGVSGSDGNYQSQIMSGNDVVNWSVRLNGQKVGTGDGSGDCYGGFLHRGFHVVSYQVAPDMISCIGTTDYRSGLTSGDGATKPRGGVQLGEILLWNRKLSDEEFAEVEAYLAKKWLGSDIPGYKSGADESIPDVQVVKSTGSAEIEVPQNETASIRCLEAFEPIVKTGAGVLEIGAESDTRNLTVKEGSVKVSKCAPTITEESGIAPGAVIHLDATEAASMFSSEREGKKFVELWHSRLGGEVAMQEDAAFRPWLNEEQGALCNGRPVVDFGGFSTYKSGRATAESKFMTLSSDFDSIRAIYVVLGTQAGGGNPLGEKAYSDGNWADYIRSGDMTAGFDKGLFQDATTAVQQGEIYTNGVKTTISALPTGGYELVEVHPAAGTHISALCTCQGTYMFGGARIGELIAYERPLSEREKVATRNYLLAKWFPEVARQALPPEPTDDVTASIRAIDASSSLSLDLDQPLVTTELSGMAAVEKSGKATLSVKDMSAYGGEINVLEGTLALTGRPLTADPVLVKEGRILHLDAAEGVVAVTNADGIVSVTKWLSKLDDGWAAVPGGIPNKDLSYPTLLPYELNLNPVVQLTYSGWSGPHYDYMVFQKDGVVANLGGIKSAFWVIGSQEGGGFVLGGGLESGGTHAYSFHRGGDAGRTATDKIVNNSSDANVRGSCAVWKLNGEMVNPLSTGLSGGYDLLSFVQTEDAKDAANADGLAFDGRILNTPYEDYRDRTGHQRLGELIVYDRILSDDERADIEAYLAAKWGFGQKSMTNTASIVLSSEATLSTTGNQYVDTLSGDGFVDGDITVRKFVANAALNGFLVGGTLTVAENPVVAFENLPTEVPDALDIPLAAATGFAGMESLATATFVGVPDGVKVRLRVKSGVLYACLRSGGIVIIVR